MDYAAFIRATAPAAYTGLGQQQYPRAYRGSPQGHHPGYPSYAVDTPPFMSLAHLHHQHQQHAAAAIMGQGNMPPSKSTEPKPRLSKDEVELLEREFAKNSKPNSSTKRDLAERMGVDVARINNWFQNRRAKAKQMKKTQEFEEQQARERAACESESSEDQDQVSTNESFGASAHQEALAISTAAFPCEADVSNTKPEPSPSEAKPAHFGPEEDALLGHPIQHHFVTDGEAFANAGYSSPDSVFSGHSNGEMSVSTLGNDFASSHQPDSYSVTIPCSAVESIGLPPQGCHPPPVLEHLRGHAESISDLGSFEGFHNSIASGYVMPPGSSFPSQLLPTAADAEHVPTQEAVDPTQPAEGCVKLEQFSPASMSQSPPPEDDLRFKSPPPADIPTRRNIRRPAPLGLSSLRSPSHCFGPKTGIEPRRVDMPSPMRRIASASGTMSGRIQKPMSASAPRSPFNKETFIQSLQGTRSPVLGSINGALSPRLADNVAMSPPAMREATVSSSASDDDQMYTLNSVHVPFREHAIKTPPLTPGFPAGQFDGGFPFGYSGPLNFPQDESCMTPGLISNGSDFDLSVAGPAPGYACASQPVTPSFPGHGVGPTFWTTLNGGSGPNNVEYNFPESYPELTGRLSPGVPKTKQFQFTQNVTPQDFNGDK